MRFVETWTSATLVTTRDLTPDIREFLLRSDDPIATFAPGSHINVGISLDGSPETRSYSLVGEADAQVGEAAHGVIGAVRPAFVLTDHGDAIGVVAVGSHPRGVVDGNAGVVAEFGTRDAVWEVLMIEGRPIAGQIDLRGGRDRQRARSQSCHDRNSMAS